MFLTEMKDKQKIEFRVNAAELPEDRGKYFIEYRADISNRSSLYHFLFGWTNWWRRINTFYDVPINDFTKFGDCIAPLSFNTYNEAFAWLNSCGIETYGELCDAFWNEDIVQRKFRWDDEYVKKVYYRKR